MIINKWKIYCETDSKWEYWHLPETESAPTTCPTDTAHTITAGSVAIAEVIDPNIQKSQIKIGEDEISLLEFGYNFTAAKNSITDHDKLLPIKYIRGCWVEAIDQEFGDNIRVQIIDKDGVGVTLGWYSQAQFDAMGNIFVASEFGTNVQIPTNGIYTVVSESRSKAMASGLYVRVKYDSKGVTNDVKVKFNCRGYNDAA